ncbi:MAG: BtaA family protein [Scytonematopsis contorta HA4267-MV1]|jgi:S-adenosylmethionine-diacylglycerol 3-amino-3-carboxypropyl transferase|nr:BtaA family protein [Scytonematopsis contorta HA4267-MV1]
MHSEIKAKANFSEIRYAQCWEDADILLKALNIQPGHTCLSIASAGDNTLAMLSCTPKKVIAIDLNPAQIACLELRVAAYRELTHPQLLMLIGSALADATDRIDLYYRCRPQLSPVTRNFWDERIAVIAQGIGKAGKFERYLALFRKKILPFIHNNDTVTSLLKDKTETQRQVFYSQHWNNWQWRLLFRIFFSQFILGRFGRDPSFFDYVQDNIAEHLLQRTGYAITTLNPAENPYFQWIATEQHLTALPYALRLENFEKIRSNLDRLEWHCIALEDYLYNVNLNTFDCYNLSNIFEYVSSENYRYLLKELINAGRSGARLAYWNLLVKRSRPEDMKNLLHSLGSTAKRLYQEDKAFFYSAFVVEEIIHSGKTNCCEKS